MTIFQRHRIMVLAVMSALYFLLMATTFNSLGQVLPFMVKDLGLSWTAAGFGFTLLGTACGAASMVPAATLRKFGTGTTLWIGTALLVAGFLALALAKGALVYQAGALLLGLGFCFSGAIPAVHLISLAFHRRRASAIGLYFTLGNCGAVFGPLFFLAINALTADWRIYWGIVAVLFLVLGSTAAILGRTGERTLLDAAQREGDSEGWSVRAAMLSWQYWLVVAAYTGCLLVNTSVHSFAFQHFLEHGIEKGVATGVISASAAVAAAAAGLAGVVGQKVSARALMALALLMSAICSASLGTVPGAATMAVFAVCFGVGMGFSMVASTLLLRSYFGGKAALELYSLMTVVSTSAAIGPSIGGSIHDSVGNFIPLFRAFAAILVALCLAVAAMRAPGKAPR